MTLSAIDHLSPHDILGLAHVKRWGNTATARSQNLAEHSCLVALLAARFAGMVSPPLTAEARGMVLELALIHDISEVEFGDIPTPTKHWLRDHRGLKYDEEVERAFWATRGVPGNPLQLAEQHQPRLMALVRIADVVEAALFFWKEGGDRDKAVKIVHESLGVVERKEPALRQAVADLLAAVGVPCEYLRETA